MDDTEKKTEPHITNIYPVAELKVQAQSPSVRCISKIGTQRKKMGSSGIISRMISRDVF